MSTECVLIITLVSESFGESIDSNSNAVIAVIDDNVRKEALRKYFVDLLTREYHAASALIAANKPAVSQVREEHVHSSDTNDAIPPRNKKLKLLDDMELLSNSHTTDTDGAMPMRYYLRLQHTWGRLYLARKKSCHLLSSGNEMNMFTLT